MIARAPGKLVLSGAYVVLDGAPAVVCAISRYAVADSSRAPDFVSDEIRAAFGSRTPPHVDVSELRTGARKLGVGSSAASLVAAIAASRGDIDREEISAAAYSAHRRAQAGGSGIDVVSSTFGGSLVCRTRDEGAPDHESVRLPEHLVLEAWLCPVSAITSELLGPVRALKSDSPARYRSLTDPAASGSLRVVSAIANRDAESAIVGLREQTFALSALGDLVARPIVPTYVRELDRLAEREGGVMYCSGAGGGDIAIFAGLARSSVTLRGEAARRGLSLLSFEWSAAGVSLDGDGDHPRNLLSTSPQRHET